MELSYFTQVVDNLKNKYLELRAIEKRSNAMMSQVIDTFYLMEGLNRLQADLDCLDLLMKKNSYLERVIKLKIETREQVLNRKSMLRSLFTRSVKAITSSDIYKQIRSKFPKKDTETAFSQLKRITHSQRNKISELMDMVQCTIVTNYEVLEQLQQISCLHLKNTASWNKLQKSMTHENVSESGGQQINVSVACEEPNLNSCVQNVELGNELIVPEPSKSNVSITTICKNSTNTNISLSRPKLMFTRARLENTGLPKKRFAERSIAIGDGQVGGDSEPKEAKPRVHYQVYNSRSKDVYDSGNQLRGDFVDTKSEDERDDSNEVLKKILDS